MLKKKTVLLSSTEYDDFGAETVHAKITNDWAKDAKGKPIFGKQYAYEMTGFQLHGPIPKEIRGGFNTSEEAEAAARQEYHDWRSGKVPPETKVTRQEYWEMHYRMNRYLGHLSNDEYAERVSDVMNNLVTIPAAEEIGLSPVQDWFESWAHVLEESRLRRTGVPADLAKERLPNCDWPGLDQAFNKFKALKVTPEEYLVKYSKLEFLKATLETGEIRISPASSYEDPSLNHAIRDDELSFSLRPQPTREGMSEKLSSMDGDRQPLRGTELVTTATDYYVYCMANLFSLRLFGDFEADACLIITRPFVFIERLGNAVVNLLLFWKGEAKPVKYLDPVKTTSAEIDIFWTKDFRYSYQSEYRLVWKPPLPRQGLPHIHVRLGSLADCCELISLKG